METSVYVISIRAFWKRRTHLSVRPYIAIILPRSWRLRASFPRAFRRILSLHSVDRVQPFFALPDVGTYRLGASVARTPPTAKQKVQPPENSRLPPPRVFWGVSSCMETPVHVIRIRPFWKRRTHLPVRPYIAIIILRSWCSPASAVLAVPHILSLHSVGRPPAFSAMRDVGTYRLGASVARTPPAAK